LKTFVRRTGFVFAAAALLGFSGLSFWHGGRIALSDMETLSARWMVRAWGEKPGMVHSPEAWAKTYASLQNALRLTPDNAQLLEHLGYLNASKAQAMGWPKMGSPEEAERQDLLTTAIDYYREATVLRPTFPYPWANMALAKHLKGTQDEEFWVAFDKSLQYGLYADGVQPVLAKLAFAQWTKLSPQRRELVTVSINAAKGQTRRMLMGMIAKSGIAVPGM
jgi:hypothetical protein